MTHATRTFLIPAFAVALLVAGCTSAQPSASPSASLPTASLPPSASPLPTASPAASLEPSAAPSSSVAPSPTASSSSAACTGVPSNVQPPSDRLVDLKVSSTADADRLTFVFGNPSLPGPAGPPQGALSAAKPPFTRAGSGASIDLLGAHAVQVRFSEMSITNDAGEQVYQGAPEIKPDLPALRHAVQFDASEGIVGWYVGYDGPGCVTLVRDGNNLVLTIPHA